MSCELQLWCLVKFVSPDMPLITAASSASCRDKRECHWPEQSAGAVAGQSG